MDTNFKRSVNRAISLMGTPADYKNYIPIKIKPSKGGCCCFHCWPHTWNSVNKYIYPFGPLEDEGDVLLSKNDAKYVLECHESGPEIILYIGLGTAAILFAKSIVELITVLLKALQKEERKCPGNLKIIRRRQIKGQIEEEEIMEINIPLSKDTIEKLNDNVKNAIINTDIWPDAR